MPSMGALGQLANQGLNLQAVMAVQDLPAAVQASLSSAQTPYRQLVLLGHRGRQLWDTVKAEASSDEHPIDQAVLRWVTEAMAQHHPGMRFDIVYPGPTPLSLIRLGECAGWHHASPFWQGVDAQWGSWFAYRAVLLCDSDWPLTPRRQTPSPCLSCTTKPCVTACPADALSLGRTDGLTRCMTHRLQPDSPCTDRCLARLACPVGSDHRYSEAQLQHHYRHSMAAIRAHASVTPVADKTAQR